MFHSYHSWNDVMNDRMLRFVTLQQLEALVFLVEERSFSKAARRMRLTQPSMSKHIKNLEALSGAPLINRERSGISLTPEGVVLFNYARRILRLRDEAEEKIALARLNIAGNVYAGASTIPSTYILPGVITELARSHPEIRVHVITGDTESVIQMVLAGQVEIGIVGLDTQDRRLVSEPVWHDELVLVSKPGHPLSTCGRATMETVLGHPFVMREKGSGTRKVFERYVSDVFGLGIDRFHVVAEMGSTEAVKESVMAGLGVSVVSIHSIRRELSSGVLARIQVEGMDIHRSFHLVRRRHSVRLPHHDAFIEVCRAYDVGGG